MSAADRLDAHLVPWAEVDRLQAENDALRALIRRQIEAAMRLLEALGAQ